MNYEEIEKLKRNLSEYFVVWKKDNEYFLVVSIGSKPDEPSKCACLQNSTYVALYNADINDFFILQQLF